MLYEKNVGLGIVLSKYTTYIYGVELIKRYKMTSSEINTEIKKTKAIMDALLVCVKDKSISVQDRNQYYGEYLQASTYYLKLNQVKPQHNLTIA